MRRVVITGLGAITPIGNDKDTFWQSLRAGRNGVGKLSHFDATGFTTQIAAEVKDFDPSLFLTKKDVVKMKTAKFIQFAIACALMAKEDAKLDLSNDDPYRVGAVVGSGIGGIAVIEEQHKILLEKGPRRVSPHFVTHEIANMAPGQIAIYLGIRGPNFCLVTACATGNHCIGDAFRIIQRGDADVMFAGGAEAAITPLCFAGFCAMKAMSTRNDDPEHASRPFDKGRDGFVMGEGAGIVVLESLEHAVRRGVPIYAELIGYGMSSDAYQTTAPLPDGAGAASAMSSALADAKVRQEEIDYINAHSPSTVLGDKGEVVALKSVFKEHIDSISVSSTKSMTGHLLGAAGAVEFIASVLAIHEGIIPPTINHENPDPDCDIDCVPNRFRRAEVNVALTNAFGFGGHNATLVIKSASSILDTGYSIPASNIQNPESSIQYPVSSIQYPESSIQNPESRIQNSESRIQNPVSRIQNLHTLECKIGHTFNDIRLLDLSLTHKSSVGVNSECNERMEFLGDSVLEVVVSSFLYSSFPEYTEGQLSKLKAVAVSRSTLSLVARELGLGSFIRFSAGEVATGGTEKPSNLANALEALIASVYLDGGIEKAQDFILSILEDKIYELDRDELKRDYKTALQEYWQAGSRKPPAYTVIAETGPDHDKRFEIEVKLAGEPYGRGIGRSKKEAEQKAAEKALETIFNRRRENE
jgi:3-oxoacyl-[acyl-carrier-protein] synthase II